MQQRLNLTIIQWKPDVRSPFITVSDITNDIIQPSQRYIKMYGINSPKNDPQYEGSKTVHFSVIYSK